MANKERKELIRAGYRGVLGREPDPEGMASYADRFETGLTEAAFLDELRGSDEFRGQFRIDLSAHAASLDRWHDKYSSQLSKRLEACKDLSWSRFDELWMERFNSGRDLVIGQTEYAQQHKRRFYELFNAAKIILEPFQAPRVLEVGASEYSHFYKDLFPQVDLTIADRPVPIDFPGFTEDTTRMISSCDEWFALDLNQPEMIERQMSNGMAKFHLIILAEVLEHLIVDPVLLLDHLSRLLAPGGRLYLTTPNFFSQENIEQLRSLANPQPMFPGEGANWDAHYHHREYSMPELLDIAGRAGLHSAAFYFSDCWDKDPALYEFARGNLVLVLENRRQLKR